MIGYLLGLILVARMPVLEWAYLLVILLVPVLLRLRGQTLRLQSISFVLAFVYASSWGLLQLQHRLPAELGKVDLFLTGQIDSLVRLSDQSQRFELLVEEPPQLYSQLRRLRLTLYSNEPRLRQGDRLTLVARLQAPQRYLNDASPDSKRRALQQGIDATGYVRELQSHLPSAGIRQRLYDQLIERFPAETASTLAALVLGEAAGLSDTHWMLLRKTATVHLVVVSGLHLGVLTLAGILTGRLLLLPLLLMTPMLARRLWGVPMLLALILATCYLGLGGAGLALQRAWVLVLVLLTGRLWGRTLSLSLRLRVALVLVTLIDPLAVLDLGFWLSFGLVWLLLQHSRWRSNIAVWVTPIRVQLFLSLALLPVLLVGVGQLNLLSLFTNLWAIPWLSFGVMLLPIMLPLSYLSDFVAELTVLWIDLFWVGLDLCSEIGLSSDWPPPASWLLPVAIVGTLLLLLPLRLKLVGALILTPYLLYPNESTKGFKARLIDVGQGQASVIDLPWGRWVYDTGPSFGSSFSAAQLTLIPTLKRDPQRPLDGLIISHSDRDHAGGLAALLAYRQPTLIYSGQPEQTGGVSCRGPILIEQEGVELHLMGLEQRQSDNDSSCVMLLRYRECTLLIAGDLSSGAELELIRQLEPTPITWLMLSHHGSRTSTSDAWLDHWQPKTLLVSRGRNNPFGHPHAEVMELVNRRNLELLDTAVDGEIELIANDQGCRLSTFYDRQQRYWY